MFVNDVINPVIDARLQNNMSLTRLANRLKLSKQYISRAEHGTYASLNTELVKYVARQLNTNPHTVMTRYKNFQEAVRRRTVIEVNPQILARRGSKADGHVIFTTWRSDYWPSSTAFSNAFCIHPEIVRTYEEGIRDEMPVTMRDVLRAANILDPNWTEHAKLNADQSLDRLEIVKGTRKYGSKMGIAPGLSRTIPQRQKPQNGP